MKQPWLPERWDEEADVVVVGFGGAGAAVAITAHDLGARVLLLEKAPEGEEGGNTRIAGQGYLHVNDVDKAIAYLNALCGRYSVPQAMVRAWAEEVHRNNDWVASIGGDPQEHQHQPAGIEFPDLPGAIASTSSTTVTSSATRRPGSSSNRQSSAGRSGSSTRHRAGS
jgi:succinate dehydrogenase/fumarate reductase flavoprotein subunit